MLWSLHQVQNRCKWTVILQISTKAINYFWRILSYDIISQTHDLEYPKLKTDQNFKHHIRQSSAVWNLRWYEDPILNTCHHSRFMINSEVIKATCIRAVLIPYRSFHVCIEQIGIKDKKFLGRREIIYISNARMDMNAYFGTKIERLSGKLRFSAWTDPQV